MNKTYYSKFFPDPDVTGGREGSTKPVVLPEDWTGLEEELGNINDRIEELEDGGSSGTPPGPVTGLVLSTSSDIDIDGTVITSLKASWVAVTDPRVSLLELEIKEGTGNFVTFVTGKESTEYSWSVRANELFTVRIRAVSGSGVRGPWSPSENIQSAKDTVAPGKPAGLIIEQGYSELYLAWSNPSDTDLKYAEVLVNTVDDLASASSLQTLNTAPGKLGSTMVPYSPSFPDGTVLFLWVRCIDSSGNVGLPEGPVQGVPAKIEQKALLHGLSLVENVTALPATENFQGRVVMYAGKLYRWTSDTVTTGITHWTAEVPAGDISGQIVNGQLAINSVTADKILAGSISTGHLASAAVTTDKLAAGSVVADKILAGTITGDKFLTTTSLPGTITVGSTGVSIGTIEENSSDPAAKVNSGTTQIDPGKIVISGGTTLSDWRRLGDLTKIDGGSISANTIDANKVTVGLRGVNTDVQFSCDPATNMIYWTAGTISYVNDLGASATVSIASGNTTWLTGVLAIWWVKGAATLSVGNIATPQADPNSVILATYKGGRLMTADYGRTIIDGAEIRTGTVTADALFTGEVITNTAQIKDAIITGAKIVDATIGTAKIGDAQITGAKIKDLEVDTIKIKDHAVSIPEYHTYPNKAITTTITAYPYDYLERYVFVGPGNGSFIRTGPGQYTYVGVGNGDYMLETYSGYSITGGMVVFETPWMNIGDPSLSIEGSVMAVVYSTIRAYNVDTGQRHVLFVDRGDGWEYLAMQQTGVYIQNGGARGVYTCVMSATVSDVTTARFQLKSGIDTTISYSTNNPSWLESVGISLLGIKR